MICTGARKGWLSCDIFREQRLCQTYVPGWGHQGILERLNNLLSQGQPLQSCSTCHKTRPCIAAVANIIYIICAVHTLLHVELKLSAWVASLFKLCMSAQLCFKMKSVDQAYYYRQERVVCTQITSLELARNMHSSTKTLRATGVLSLTSITSRL